MKSKKPAKYISIMIASALSLSVLFFAEYAMDVHATETQDSDQLQVMENTEQLQTEPQDKETTKAESDNESAGSGTDEGMAADVNVKATSKTNNIIGEVFANIFNDGDDETAKAKREASLEEYPFETHDLEYYGDSLRLRILEGGDEEGSNYLAYRDSYLLIGEEESGNYSVEFSKDGREAYVSPAIPASELEDKMGLVFLADYVSDDVILVFDGEPAYDGDTMTVPVLTAEDITVNMLFSDVKLSIEQPQAKNQTKSNSKGISLKADPPGGYYKLISGTNWHGAVTGFSVDEQAVIPVIDIPNKQVNVNFTIRTTLEFDIFSAPSPGGDEEDIVKITELEFPAEVLDFTYEYNMLVRFDKTPVHVKGKINSELVYNIGADGNNDGGVRITEFHNPVTLDTFELVNREDVNKPISFFIGSQFKAKGQMYPLIREQSVYALNIQDQDFRGGCEFGALHLKDQYTERDRSEAEIHTCLKKGREGCLALQIDEVQKNKIQAVINMIFVGREVGIANGGYRTVDSHQFYNSLTYGSGFDEGHCPHKFYRIPVRVVSREGVSLPGLNVTVSDPIDLLDEEEAALAKDRTNDDGEAAIYLPYIDKHKYTVVVDGQVYGAPVSGSKQQIHNFHRGDNELVEIILDTDFVNLKGQITWEGDEGKKYLRPESVNLKVLNNKGDVVESFEAAAYGDWKYELQKLPRRDSEGKLIEYRVVPSKKVKGYESVPTPPSYDEQTRTWTSDVTNVLTGYCAIDIKKKITGDAPENPVKYTFQVEPINEGVPGAQYATEPINENIEITGARETKVEFLLDVDGPGRFYYKFKEKEGDDPDCKYDEKEWFVIIYKERIWDGDDLRIETKTWVVDDLNNANLDELEESNTVTFTNKYPDATVKKEWDIDLEDKDRPESIQILVQKKTKDNEGDKDKWTDVKVLELSEENDWTAKFLREDDSAEYRVRELKEENALTNLTNELRTMIKGSASSSYEDIINKIKGSEYYNKLPESVRNAADQGKDKLIKELGTTEAKLYDKLIDTLDLVAAADRVVYDEDDSDKPKGKDGKDDPETNAVRYHVDDHHTKYQVSYEDKKDENNEEVQNYTITNKAIVEVDVIKRWVTFGVEDEDLPDSAWLVLMCKPNPEALESAKSIPGVDLGGLLDYEFPVINPISGGNNPISIISELVLGIDIDIFGIFDKTTPKLAIAKAEKKDDGEEGNWTVHFTDSKYHMGIPMEYKGAELSSEVIKQIIKYVSKGTINLPISYNPFSNYFSIPTKAIRTIAGITDVNQVLDLSGLSQKLLEKAKGLTVEDIKNFGPENILDDDQLMANVINVKIDSDSNDDPDDEKITISGSKTWDDNNNKAGKRPESITVRLRADGEEVDSKTVTADDEWKWEFKDLPKTDDGDEIEYTVSEDAVEDYQTTVDGANITNKYIGKTTSKKQVNVYKVWNDGNDIDEIRPDKVTVNLKANGEDTGKSLELSKNNSWTGSFRGLDVKDDSGEEIKYTVEEATTDVITGTDGRGTYSIDVRGSASEGFTITNKHTPEQVTISGSKTWDDNDNVMGKRPESITVRLRRDGRAIDSQTVTAENGWKWEFKDLDRTDGGGKEIKYTVSEDVVENYKTTVNGTDITNEYNGERTQVNVFKVWNDENDIDRIRPEKVTVKLKVNGQDTDETIELSESNGWTGSFTGMDAKDEQGKDIKYTVEEVTTDVITGTDGEGTYASDVSGNATEGFTITNKHTPETITISGSKTWEDNDNKAGKRPDSITVRLRADGKDVDEQTVTAENGWEWEFKDKQKTEGSTAIKYTVSEDAIEDYQTTVNGADITNKYIDPRKTQVNVFKVWDDNDNIDGIRPNKVTVKLKANGQDTEKTVELSKSNGWSESFTDLDVTDESLKDIEYTVEEVKDTVITGTDGEGTYSSAVNGDAKKGFTITNKHTSKLITVSGKKTWEDEDNKMGERPDTITVKLLANGEDLANGDETETSVKTTKEGRWKFFFTNLPRKDEQGNDIKYTVKEEEVEGYTTEIKESSDYKFEIINTLKPRVDINVNKEWDDKDDQDGIRPKSVEVKLLENGNETGKTLTLSETNEWKDSFKNLHKEDKDGNAIEYTVEEIETEVIKDQDGPGSYSIDITGSAEEGYTITNKHTPETITLSGSKTWDDKDNQDGQRPESITVRLIANGQEVASKEVTAQDDWKWVFTDLAKYSGGKEIKYALTEDPVENYTPRIEGMNITNTHTPDKTQVSVAKVWDDQGDSDGLRPEFVTVHLLADGVDTGRTMTISEADGWWKTFTGLDKNKDGKEITYSITEDPVEGYETTIYGDTNIFLIRNFHKPETINIEGKKVWDDNNNSDGKRPEKITIRLYRDGDETAHKEVTAKDGWKWSFEEYNRNSNGKPSAFTISEDKVEGYVSEVKGSASRGFTVTNKYTPNRTQVNVTGSWDDENDQDGIRPGRVVVKLLADGKETGKNVELSAKNNWTGTFSDLYIKKEGKDIRYTVEQVATEVLTGTDGPGTYANVTSGDAEKGFAISNIHTPEKISLSGSKTWEGEGDQGDTRPESIIVRLKAGDTEVASRIVTADDDWKWTFDNLPKYKEGKEIRYFLTEDAVDGYTSTVDGMDVSNKYTPDKTQVNVNKRWVDGDDNDGKRPKSVKIHLLADGTDTGKTLVLNEANGWMDSFTELDKNRNGGEVIDYTVSEEPVDGYETSYVRGEGSRSNSWQVVNRYDVEKINISGSKVWDDNNNRDGKRPEKITVRLYRDGDEVAKKEVTAEDNWKWSFGEFNKNSKGNPCTFTVSEDKVDDYTTEITGNPARGFTVTNKYNPDRTQVNVTGLWEDKNDQDGIRPDKVTIKLLADGKDTGKTLELTAKNNWIGSFPDLYTRSEGKDISYTVEQVETDVLTGTDGPDTYANAVAGDPEKGFVITNIHTPERVTLSGSKTWDDNDNRDDVRPERITVRLRADGEEIASRPVTADDDWKWTFDKLPKYKEGKEIRYFLTEDLVDGYTSSVNGMDVRNTHTPDETQVNVFKLWDDLDDNDGKRPGTVRINLYADGRDTGKSIVLSDANGWMGSFKNIAKYKDGKLIDYTISEDTVDEYEASYARGDGSQANSWIVVNKREIEKIDISGSKVWDDEDDRDGMRPEKITVRLYLDGVEVENKEVTAEDEWKWTFEGCLKYRDGKEAEYTISEDPVKGYETKIQGDVEDGFTVTNSYSPKKTSVSVNKDWDDGDDHDNIRPSSVTVRLLADGVDTGKTKKLSLINRWKGSFDDLYVYSDGRKIEYTVEEEKTDIVTDEDHEKTYASSVSGDANKGFTVRNVHTPWYTIVYDLNGGEYKGSKADISDRYRAGTVISIHEAPVREGYTFLYWKGSEYHPGDKYKVTEDHKFVAQWKKNKGPNDPNNPNNPNDPNDPDHPEKHTPTGDESHLALWCGVGAMSLLTLLALLAVRRRRWE